MVAHQKALVKTGCLESIALGAGPSAQARGLDHPVSIAARWMPATRSPIFYDSGAQIDGQTNTGSRSSPGWCRACWWNGTADGCRTLFHLSSQGGTEVWEFQPSGFEKSMLYGSQVSCFMQLARKPPRGRSPYKLKLGEN